MNEALNFILTHGYAVLFSLVLAEQLGLPLPSPPVLLAGGALSGSGKSHLGSALPLAALSSLSGVSAGSSLDCRPCALPRLQVRESRTRPSIPQNCQDHALGIKTADGSGREHHHHRSAKCL